MEKLKEIFDGITLDDTEEAAYRAFRGHSAKSDVKRFVNDFRYNCNEMHNRLKNGTWRELISYRSLDKMNNNGKLRHLQSPDLFTRIYQHLFLNKVEGYYFKRDNLNGVNCKPGFGITAKEKSKSAVKRLKHYFYDCRNLNYYLIIDQRKCYDHINEKTFRRLFKRICADKKLIDFAIGIGFVDGKLPIGTPTSPLIHHIIMMWFDYLAKSMTKYSIRYADNCFMAFETKEEAHQAMWRIQNYWWYELGIRAKRQSIILAPMEKPCDFCGFVFHRNPGKTVTDHDKGYTTIRKDILKRAKKCKRNESWASYFGILQHSDSFTIMKKIEQKMKLTNLTSKIKINRHLDARNIEIKELINKRITVYDYEIRYNSQREANWIKCLVGFDEIIEGEKTGKVVAREFHGNYQGIIQFILMCEKEYGKSNILPLEDAEIENQCGYIFKGSTNQLNYIE